MTTADPEKGKADPKSDAKKDGKKDGAKADATDSLSEEDLELRQHLEALVATAIGEPKFEGAPDVTVPQRCEAIDALRAEVRSASATVAAIPKALKFLGRHYARLKHSYHKEAAGAPQVLDATRMRAFADVLSVVAMAYSDSGEDACESLRFRLAGSADADGGPFTLGALVDFEPWGQEYVRSLCAEVTKAWSAHEDESYDASKRIDKKKLEHLVVSIVPFQLRHSSEPDAVDLLLEVEMLDKLASHIDAHNYARVCLYLLSSCHFLPPPDDRIVLECAYNLYFQVKQFPDAAIVAIKLNDRQKLQVSGSFLPSPLSSLSSLSSFTSLSSPFTIFTLLSLLSFFSYAFLLPLESSWACPQHTHMHTRTHAHAHILTLSLLVPTSPCTTSPLLFLFLSLSFSLSLSFFH